MWGRKATAELNKIKPEVMCDLDHREEESQVEELVLRGTQLKQWARLRAHTLAKVDIHIQNSSPAEEAFFKNNITAAG